ncbi:MULTISPECIES: DUF4286 family protein [Legionella]|uniref:DUF4286 domain-containing protein n=1 Tax=Legionella maceachernii TaxID=466 RepID=A0A0W0VXK9_9GAMM|nr:DUF4286 family protein [Legionella maceachernii]KTD24674.1 hypothetical protein Lmac_2761 [Legionella maceachernii]SKA26564.1 protein of unknown function [Legionella maceachernii]SUP01877.1 Uncharacterised protein [Legionella maceachernii]
MIIYEVNLSIDADIYPEFQVWLKSHITEMVQFPGFIQASILMPEKVISDKEKLTIQYQLENRQALDHYFTEFAPIMREKGVTLFKNKFSAERRVFEVKETIFK